MKTPLATLNSNRRYRLRNAKVLREYERLKRLAFPEKKSKANSEYYLRRPEAQKIRARRWRNAHPNEVKNHYHSRRARIAKGITINCSTHIRILRRKRKCFWCRRRVNKLNRTIDHVIPISMGGKHHPENMVAACRSCNSRKGDCSPELNEARNSSSDSGASSPEPQRLVRNGSLAKKKREAGNPRRYGVSITSYRVRPVDPDNLCGKYFVDSLRYASVLPGDTEADILYSITQKKVEKKTQEKTKIEISYP